MKHKESEICSAEAFALGLHKLSVIMVSETEAGRKRKSPLHGMMGDFMRSFILVVRFIHAKCPDPGL